MESQKYWNNRYSQGGNSGYGSYGEQLAKKLAWLKNLDIKSISEIGCGDFNFGKNILEMYPNAYYEGSDISETIIEKNKTLYPKYTFTQTVGSADLLLCVDVLFHVLEDEEYNKLLGEIRSKWTKYLAITAYERDGTPEETGGHLKIRKFDYKSLGEPLIREVVEEDGQLYFYLFKKPEIDITKVSCCLNTKESVYPQQILDHIAKFPFGEVLIRTNSDSPYRKYELFNMAKYDLIYYQDDDAICPIAELLKVSDPKLINVAMKSSHFESYKDLRMTMGLGWGSFFPKSVLSALKVYTDKYGEDELFKRDTEKILTQLVYPQNRFSLPIIDLPSAWSPGRLYQQPEHWSNMNTILVRYDSLLTNK